LVLDLFTNPYRIPCSLCETAWCFWFGDPATYHRLPHGTCTLGWILVWSSAALPRLTMRYHACLLSLHRSATFTSHHLRPDTHTDTHREHTRIEHSKTWAHYIKVSSVAQHSTAQHSRHSTNHMGWLARRHTPHGSSACKKKKKKIWPWSHSIL